MDVGRASDWHRTSVGWVLDWRCSFSSILKTSALFLAFSDIRRGISDAITSILILHSCPDTHAGIVYVPRLGKLWLFPNLKIFLEMPSNLIKCLSSPNNLLYDINHLSPATLTVRAVSRTPHPRASNVNSASLL